MRSHHIVRTILFFSISLVVAVQSAAGQNASLTASGILTGRILIVTGGIGVRGATVAIAGTTLSTRSDSLGRFILQPIPVGAQIVLVQKVGYLVTNQSVTIVASSVTNADIALERVATTLDTVRTAAKERRGKPARLANTTKYDEFYERRMIGAGGIQLTHEDLVKKNADISLVYAFSGIPGVKIQRIGSHYQLGLPSCPQTSMAVFVDNNKIYPLAGTGGGGMAFTMPGRIRVTDDGPLDALQLYDLNNIEAIEIYKRVDGMPAIAVGDACAALFIWTK